MSTMSAIRILAVLTATGTLAVGFQFGHGTSRSASTRNRLVVNQRPPPGSQYIQPEDELNDAPSEAFRDFKE